ncbi:hypothetical protein [Streptomyces yangpuensis]|uniref:hypothetical protein n=1 Tax=Streptomyces yangpuensis TaxID=1648182 RepID=UPI0038300B3B
MGQGNTQNNTFGYDPAQLAAFAQQVLAAAHTTDVRPASRDAVTAEAEALQAELQRPQPDAGRVRIDDDLVLQLTADCAQLRRQ